MHCYYFLLLQEADYHQEGKKRLRFTAVPSQNLPGPDEQKVNLWNLDLEADIEMLEANTAGGGNGDIPADDADTAEENPLAIEPESAALDIKPEIWTKDVASLATKSLEPSAKDRAIQTKTQDKDQTIVDLLKQVENLKVRYIKMSELNEAQKFMVVKTHIYISAVKSEVTRNGHNAACFRG